MTKYEQMHVLFDETIARLAPTHGKRFREYRIFVEVLGDTPEMRAALSAFLHDVSTCPSDVEQWCQKQLNS